ncbi:MAG: cytochrome c oxidase subunit II [Actinomycetota bacterium]|nr:cytochrome c oxidase subunit II [Actinomycetota bacterium]
MPNEAVVPDEKGLFVGLGLSPRFPRRQRGSARSLLLGFGGAAMVLFLTGCSAGDRAQLRRLAQPIPATKEAPHMYHLWQWSWLAAMLTGIIVWSLIFYCTIRYRRRREDDIPVQTRYNLPIEIFYTIAPIMMVIVFFFFTVKTQNEVVHDYAHPDHNVTVVGQQWSWTFNYVHEAAIGGKTVYDVGTPADRPTMWLVNGKSVEFHLYSPDVIHSFWVPVFLFKMDVIPGRDNHFGVTPTRVGTFEGRCAELCGVYHSRMLFNVKVVGQAAFDAHLKMLLKQGNVGMALGGSNVNKQPGLEPTTGGQP